MCNRYGYLNPLSRIIAEFSDLGPINWDKLERNAPLDQIRPTDRAPIIRADREGTFELVSADGASCRGSTKDPLRSSRD